MLKIVVFDGGWGGEIISDYLENELGVMEIIREIDWKHAPYEGKSLSEICQLADNCLAKYMNKVDLIVLAGYTVTLASDYLKNRYRDQPIVGVGVNYYRVLKSGKYPDRITAVMSQNLLNTAFCQELRQNLPYSTFAIPDSSGWEDQANSGDLSATILRTDLEAYFELRPKIVFKSDDKLSTRPLLEVIRSEKAQTSSTSSTACIPVPEDFKLIRSDVVLLLNTNFWDLKSEFEEVFGYKVRILDFRKKLLHDVCLALDLLGVDGERSKQPPTPPEFSAIGPSKRIDFREKKQYN